MINRRTGQRPLVAALEQRIFLASASVIASEGRPAQLADADGSAVTVEVEGVGTVAARMRDSGRLALDVRNSTAETSVTVTVDDAGGNGRVTVDGLSVRGALGTLVGPDVDLRGAIRIGSLTSLKLRTLTNATVRVSGTLGALDVRGIAASSLFADHLGAVRVAGDIRSTRIWVVPADDTFAAVRSVTIRGALSSSTISALGDIGSVTAAAMKKSNVTAGVRVDESSTTTQLVQPLPNRRLGEKLFDFIGKYRIGRVSVAAGGSRAVAFSETKIGAYSIGSVVLGGVDGRLWPLREFGVAGYRVRSVQRHFQQSYAYLDERRNPIVAFAVRQISKPLTFNGLTGSYGGPATSTGSAGGAATESAGSAAAAVVEAIERARVAALAAAAGSVKFGVVSDEAESGLYINVNGRGELRARNGTLTTSAPSLAEMILTTIGAAGTSVKVEDTGRPDNINLRATSVGRCITLQRYSLGNSYPVNGGTVTVPSLPSITKALERVGATVQTFTAPVLMITQRTFELGKMFNFSGVTPLSIGQDLRFEANGTSALRLSDALAKGAAARVGSRRLPARALVSYDKLLVYGLPNGGTVALENLGRSALNAAGDVVTLLTPRKLKQSLRNAGWQLVG